MISAVTNLYSAFALLEPADEEALGITRNSIVATYAVILAAGAGLLYFALRKPR